MKVHEAQRKMTDIEKRITKRRLSAFGLKHRKKLYLALLLVVLLLLKGRPT